MKEKGEINIAIANYLENNFDDYTNLINRNDGNQVQSLDEIKHIIIGRWYYGLYLIAKEKLGIPYINHMGHINKYNEKEYGIWECLYEETKKLGIPYDFEKNGVDLFNLRNKYEYYNIKITNKNFEQAKNIYNTMYFELQNIHIKNNPIKSINMSSQNYKIKELNAIKEYIKEIKYNKIYSKIRIFEKSNAYYIYLVDKYDNNIYKILKQISYSIRCKTRNLISKNIYIDFLDNFYDNVSEILDEFNTRIILYELTILFITNTNVINSINQIGLQKINSKVINKINNIMNNNTNNIIDINNINIVNNAHKMITMFDNNLINNKNSYKCLFTCKKITIN